MPFEKSKEHRGSFPDTEAQAAPQLLLKVRLGLAKSDTVSDEYLSPDTFITPFPESHNLTKKRTHSHISFVSTVLPSG